ncbi:aromatic acid exporter family protein [Bacillus marinisedimentorum]|uniref:aromatic acid exporter family protein n=1 Tax=Bacillus marinisedimentorum TaxID=1821260 RepID=UPI000872765F|nr:aromatic acid exporter family protein [Bacillus marinisedimentorum]
MYKIGYRTMKTAVGTALSIWIAQLLQFENYASAGILTILCIQVTKKRSLISSWVRFAACILAMAFAFIFFEIGVYSPVSIGLMLLFFIPATVTLKIQEGVVTSSVILLHIYMNGDMNLPFILNELGIIVVGIGIALIMNLYMPSMEGELRKYQEEIEDNFKQIFQEISHYMRTGDSTWTGKEITRTAELIDRAKALALRDVENRVLREGSEFYRYFEMRQKQFEIIERILPILTSVRDEVEQGLMIGDFIEEISYSIHPGNTAIYFLKRLKVMRETFREMPLPKTREEFEIRAALFTFINEMEEYLTIKRHFKRSDI